MLKRRLVQALGIAACVLATYLMSSGGVVLAKAHLAQYLLERSWQASKLGDPAKPWPGADTFPVAKLTIDKLDYSAVILHGVTGEALAFGPGHMPGSAAPGASGNSVIAGHRDSHFRKLEHIALGDLIQIETANAKKFRYRVYELAVVNQYETAVLRSTDTSELTLITCYPFNAISAGGPLRYIVSAIKVDKHTALTGASNELLSHL